MNERYWKKGNEIFIGNPYGNAIDISSEEYGRLYSEQLKPRAEEECSCRIREIEWRRSRHHDEIALGLEPTEPLQPILEYI